MTFILDTNIVSELRRIDRANRGVVAWATANAMDQVYLSVITLLELERGILGAEARGRPEANVLRTWFDDNVRPRYGARTLPVTAEIAIQAAAFAAGRPLELADHLIAAPAIVHDLTLVTRNTRHFTPTGVRLLNPCA